MLDHDKPGLAAAETARTAIFAPSHLGVSPDGTSAMAMLEEVAREQLGGPARQEFSIRGLNDHEVELTLVLRDKPANRMPEAGFLSLTPRDAGDWALQKLGLWNAASNIVRGGGGQLQAVEAVRTTTGAGELTATLLDGGLVAPAGTPFMPFQPEVPSFAQGVRINLYNNKWGTNFPMWWEGTVAFRVVLRLGA